MTNGLKLKQSLRVIKCDQLIRNNYAHYYYNTRHYKNLPSRFAFGKKIAPRLDLILPNNNNTNNKKIIITKCSVCKRTPS